MRRVSNASDNPILSLGHVAQILGCHPDTVKNQAKRGKLTLLRISERRYGVLRSELDRYLRECEVVKG